MINSGSNIVDKNIIHGEVVGSTPTRSIFINLVDYGVGLSAFFDFRTSSSYDGTLLSFVSLLECTQNGDAE